MLCNYLFKHLNFVIVIRHFFAQFFLFEVNLTDGYSVQRIRFMGGLHGCDIGTYTP